MTLEKALFQRCKVISDDQDLIRGLTYSRLQVGEVQIIVRARQCRAPTCVPHLPEIRCITIGGRKQIKVLLRAFNRI